MKFIKGPIKFKSTKTSKGITSIKKSYKNTKYKSRLQQYQ